METANLDDLKGNPKNPRRISKQDYESLKRSIKEFGDLSGIIKNVRTGHLVGGHQRTEAFKGLSGEKKIIISERYEAPNSKGTVAIGYVQLDDERYTYREVDWDEGREMSANIAANRIQGEFDLDLLAQINYELHQLENGSDLLALTGQSEDEIQKLLNMVGDFGPAGEDEQGKLDNQALLKCPSCGHRGTENEFRVKAEAEA